MLHTQTVETGTFELLRSIMSDKIFSQFSLAGGTALSLLIGHRKSIDLDLFTVEEFNPTSLEKYLQRNYNFKGDYLDGFTLKGEINGVKVDFIRHDYPDVESRLQEDGIRLYSLKDIAKRISNMTQEENKLFPSLLRKERIQPRQVIIPKKRGRGI